MNIILIYELSNREFDNLVLLKRELVRRGHTVEILSKYGQMRLRYKKAILFVPNAYQPHDIDHYIYAFNAKNNPIVVYPCEQVVNKQMPAFFDKSDSNIVKYLPTLCWGKEYFEFINELGYQNKYNRIVGALQLDYCNEKLLALYKDKNSLAEQFNLPVNKKWILFISDFVFSNVDMGNHYIEEGSLSKTSVLAMRQYEANLQRDVLGWFESFLKNNDNYIIIYRKHPVEIKNELISSLERKLNGKFYEISEMNIKQWIVTAEKICTYNSTSIVECASAKKKCILLRPREFPCESGLKEYVFYKGYPRVKNSTEFDAAIKDDLNNMENLYSSIDLLYDLGGKLSYEKIADVLEEIANEEYVRDMDLKGYQKRKLMFLINSKIIFKVPIKYLYRKLWKLFKCKKRKEGFVATKEWIAVEKNIMHEIALSREIDKIIAR